MHAGARRKSPRQSCLRAAAPSAAGRRAGGPGHQRPRPGLRGLGGTARINCARHSLAGALGQFFGPHYGTYLINGIAASFLEVFVSGDLLLTCFGSEIQQINISIVILVLWPPWRPRAQPCGVCGGFPCSWDNKYGHLYR